MAIVPEPRGFDPVTGNWLPPPDAKPAWNPEARRKSVGATAWDIILGLDLAVVVLVFAMTLWLGTQPAQAAEATPATWLWASSAIVLVLFGVVPFFWVVGTRVGGLHGAFHFLKLEQPARAILRGLLLGLGCILGLFALVLALQALHVPMDNPKADALTKGMTLPLAFFVALAAAVGEEILFRGVLMRWLGVWGQAILFGLAHLDYGTPLQVIIPLALGLLFGFLVKRGARLWVPIAAHFTFDFVQLALSTLDQG